MTYPNITFAIHHAAQSMSVLWTLHLVAIEHILQSLKVTLDSVLDFWPSSSTVAVYAFSNVDWVGFLSLQLLVLSFLGPQPDFLYCQKKTTVSCSSALLTYSSLCQDFLDYPPFLISSICLFQIRYCSSLVTSMLQTWFLVWFSKLAPSTLSLIYHFICDHIPFWQ